MKSFTKKVILSTGVISAILLVSIGYQRWHSDEGIYTYNPTIDRSFILNQFKEDRYWLVSEAVTDFSAEHLVDTRSSSVAPEDYGNLSLFTYRIKNIPVGFATYYAKTPRHAYILFLDVAEPYRIRGYGKKMMQFMLDRLKKQGFLYVDLATRINNFPAQAVYRKLGFFYIDETSDGFITFRKIL